MGLGVLGWRATGGMLGTTQLTRNAPDFIGSARLSGDPRPVTGGLEPPAPKLVNAPADQFSAARALDTLHRILGKDQPHPIGTPADDAVRDRIVAELTKLGYQPQIQTAFACGDFGTCATVNNVLARLDGTDTASSDAVLLAAHYDSVPAGPGDSDDGVGVAAVLEIARALKAMPAPRHSVIFLLDEGEEAGLLGARAFVDSHPWAKDVRAAVNLDARGTSGPSVMFETGGANDWAVRLYAQHAARPAASSIFYTVYRQLPNDTDFTVFKAAGYEGLNFAFIGDEWHYHTPLDNSANVTPASLQHQGENALPAVVAFANADLSRIPRRDAVFFDLFGRAMIHWQARRSSQFALLAALLIFLQVGWLIHRKRIARRDFLVGLFGWPVTLAVAGALAIIVRQGLRFAGSTPVNWIAHPLPFEIAFWALGRGRRGGERRVLRAAHRILGIVERRVGVVGAARRGGVVARARSVVRGSRAGGSPRGARGPACDVARQGSRVAFRHCDDRAARGSRDRGLRPGQPALRRARQPRPADHRADRRTAADADRAAVRGAARDRRFSRVCVSLDADIGGRARDCRGGGAAAVLFESA